MHFYDEQSESTCLFASSLSLSLSLTHRWYHLKTSDYWQSKSSLIRVIKYSLFTINLSQRNN